MGKRRVEVRGCMTVGQAAKKGGVTVRTLQYYDKEGLLSPTAVSEGGRRLYTDKDVVRLHQILSMKSLGFSLDDIKEMTLRNTDSNVMSESLHMQLSLVEERIEQMKLMKSALQEASEVIDEGRSVDWSHMLELVNINEMEQKLKQQYFKYISQNQSAQGFLD